LGYYGRQSDPYLAISKAMSKPQGNGSKWVIAVVVAPL
jgi:hypothetical protein